MRGELNQNALNYIDQPTFGWVGGNREDRIPSTVAHHVYENGVHVRTDVLPATKDQEKKQ